MTSVTMVTIASSITTERGLSVSFLMASGEYILSPVNCKHDDIQNDGLHYCVVDIVNFFLLKHV